MFCSLQLKLRRKFNQRGTRAGRPTERCTGSEEPGATAGRPDADRSADDCDAHCTSDAVQFELMQSSQSSTRCQV